jgi:hypothetical protein
VEIGWAAVLIAAAAAFEALHGSGLRYRDSQRDWTMAPEGEAAFTVPPQRRLGVRTMVIDFGSARGGIYSD